MKKLSLVLSISVAAFAFQSCGHSGHNGQSGTDSTKSASDSSKGTSDSTKASKDSASKAAADTSGNGSTRSGITKDDAKFAKEAANGGMAEVELGSLASQKSSNAQIKEFAAMMVADHSKANDELVGIVKSKSIILPASVSTDEQDIKNSLSKKTGADFDKAYVNDMVDDHKKDIKLFEDAQKNVKDADLKAYATKTLPVLQKHLDAIQKIQDSMKK